MKIEEIDQLVEAVRALARQAESGLTDWRNAYEQEDGGEPWHTPPDDDREVIVFLNGHVGRHDHEGRKGGGHGVRLGYFDHDDRYWRVGGRFEGFVTHWKDLPPPPPTSRGGKA